MISIEGDALEKVMPHKRKMRLISRVVEYDATAKSLVAEVDITAESMFFDMNKKHVPIWVGIEYMAQSIAALSGIYGKENGNDIPRIGFILGSRNYKCFTNGFKEGKTITIKIEEMFLDTELGSFHCQILNDKKLFAKTDLNVFQPSSINKFINEEKKI